MELPCRINAMEWCRPRRAYVNPTKEESSLEVSYGGRSGARLCAW
jgi:hypothetical protein